MMKFPDSPVFIRGNFEVFDVEINRTHGYVAATLYCVIGMVLEDHLINDENVDAQGIPWMCDTIVELEAKMMHYLSPQTIQRAFDVLEKDGFFVWKKNPGGKSWYTLSPKCFGQGDRPS